MEAVIGLLLMLLGVSHGVETYCDGRINRAHCYGALGGTVVLRLMGSTSEIHRYQWLKNKTLILSGRNDELLTNLLENRSSFTPSDGTFRINNLSRTDGGEYTLKIYEKSGRMLYAQILQLNIQGFIFIDCVSNGTHISQWVHEDYTTLCDETTACTWITEGKEPGMTMITVTEASTVDQSLLICGLRTAVVILILVGIAVFFVWKKKKYEKAEDSAVPEEMDYENSVLMVEVRSSASEL